MNDLVGFLRVSRIPNLIVIAFAQALVVVFILNQHILDLRLALVIVSTLMVAAAGYLINDYYDQKIDMINRPEKVVVGISLKRRRALLIHSGLNLAAIFLGFYVDIFVGLVHLFSSVSLWLYSNYLRRLPLIGNLTIAALAGMTFLILPLYYRMSNDIVLIYALFACIMVMIREIIKDILDVKGEEAFGCLTIPVIWGIRGAKILIYLIIVIGAVLLLGFLTFQINWLLRIYFMLLAPVFLWFIYRLYRADTSEDFLNLRKFCNYIIFTGLTSIILN